MEKLIVDRIEDGIAVLEKDDLSHISVSVESFEFSLKEGDILLFDGDKYIIYKDETDEKKKKLLLMQQKLKDRKNN